MVNFQKPLFDDPFSKVIYDRNSQLLSARIASDGQWRFPGKSESEKLKTAIIEFEDRYFYLHFGFNPISMFRALKQNIKQGKIVSGGSTLTMQLVRIMRKNKSRTFLEKWIELNWAIGLECVFSKDEILDLWTQNAPFGGNVVGVEAASWRYFEHGNRRLSWAEAALIAVLPNAPSSMNPGKNRTQLKSKRNRLLKTLFERNFLSKLDYDLALLEPIPDEPKNLPDNAPHALELIKSTKEDAILTSTIDSEWQKKVLDVAQYHLNKYAENDIKNTTIVLVHVPTGEVLAYQGNITTEINPNAPFVDIAQAPRSTGSILKPLLYAKAIQEGVILPKQLLSDTPRRFKGFFPKNNDLSFNGMVPANESLFRSLNIPFVNMLQEYGLGLFLNDLQTFGFPHITRSVDDYGLSLILGGAEASLWDLVSVYSSLSYDLAWTLGKQDSTLQIHVSKNESKLKKRVYELDKSAIWATFDAMTKVVRPEEHTYWESFSNKRKVAWKTGTSFGNRDAWAIGITPEWVVGVWVGNADGHGRPNLSGVQSAAPILFDIYEQLPETSWFEKPIEEMRLDKICVKSGFIAQENCTEITEEWIPDKTYEKGICLYHKKIFLDETKQFVVNASCYPMNKSVAVSWFVLPPLQEWYFKRRNPDYVLLPSYFGDCDKAQKSVKAMNMAYPDQDAVFYIPKDYTLKRSEVVFELIHRNPKAAVFWHLDGLYLGSTTGFHQMGLSPEFGPHQLVLIDEFGEEITRNFKVVSK